MVVSATLPDLEMLNAEALKDLLRATHQQLLARQSEIEHLRLLITQLKRMQFGRKSEKLQHQIEQLQLRLEGLQSQPTHPAACEGGKTTEAESSARVRSTRKPSRRPLPEHLPRETQTLTPELTVSRMPGEIAALGGRCIRNPGICSGTFQSDPLYSSQAELWQLCLYRASAGTDPCGGARFGRAWPAGSCAGIEVCRPSTLIPPIGDVQAGRSGVGALDLSRLGGSRQPFSGTFGGSVTPLCDGSR